MLGVFGELFQEGGASGKVELAEDIVQKQERRFAVVGFEEARCREAECEDQSALLPLGPEGCRGIAQGELEVVSVRTGGGHAQARVLHARGGERFGERRSGVGKVGKPEFLSSAADVGMSELREGAEGGDDGLTGVDELLAGVDQGRFKGLDFPPWWYGSFEQEVARAQAFFIIPEGLAVGGVDLCCDKVDKTAAQVRAIPYELDILVGEPDYAPPPEVFRRRSLFYGVEGEFFALRAVIKLQVRALKVAVYEKAPLVVTDDFSEAGGSRGLEAHQEAGSLQK